MSDKTSYTQCLTHMIKGNLGAGILAMPASFAHTGLVGAVLGLPLLCLISAYCVHLLINSAEKIETKSKGQKLSQEKVNYSKLARSAFELGPNGIQNLGELVSRSVDTCLLVTQIGVCCVYIIFVVDNITSILASYSIFVPKTMVFLAIFPVTLMLSFIRTLSRLTVASLLANLLQSIGLALIVEYLLRDLKSIELKDRDNFRPISEMALGFGSAMFAFEGISVVLPLYSRMREPRLMSSPFGVINVSFFFILILYFVMGLLGYLKYGHQVRDSITLNLPATPLYDMVRAMFTASILLSYPLQFYVPNEIIWKWAKKNLMKPIGSESQSSIGGETKRNNLNGSLVVIPAATKMVAPLDGGKELPVKIAYTFDGNVVAAKEIPPAQLMNSPEVNSIGKPDGNLAKFEMPPQLAAIPAESTVTQTETPMATSTDTTTTPSPKLEASATTTMKGNSEKENLVGGIGEDKFHSNNKVKSIEFTNDNDQEEGEHTDHEWPQHYEYFCRLAIVVLTFALAMSVPKLNLLMDLIGSFSGAALCLTIPATIHMVAFWKDTKGFAKVCLILIDGFLVISSIIAGLGGSLSSLVSIVRTFNID